MQKSHKTPLFDKIKFYLYLETTKSANGYIRLANNVCTYIHSHIHTTNGQKIETRTNQKNYKFQQFQLKCSLTDIQLYTHKPHNHM